MKILKYPSLFILILICLFTVVSPTANAAITPLDEIQDYTIIVGMRTDGTMDIRYHIEWKVLDDTTEGPLEWVKIGIPNQHVDEITALSSNIKRISYTSDGGHYVRIDFDRSYGKDEIVTFDYSIHQSYMYNIERDSNLRRYSFTPGWFEKIEVKNITIKWSDAHVISSTAQTHVDDYLIWNASLGMGKKLSATVIYDTDWLTVNNAESYKEAYETEVTEIEVTDAELIKTEVSERVEESADKSVWEIVAIIAFVVLILVFVGLLNNDDDDYNSHSGFGNENGGIHTCASSCACACAGCACACACAGGGRAGCAKKDFYRTNAQVEDIKKALEDDSARLKI